MIGTDVVNQNERASVGHFWTLVSSKPKAKMSFSAGSYTRSNLLPLTLSRGFDSSDEDQSFAASQGRSWVSQHPLDPVGKRRISVPVSDEELEEDMEWLTGSGGTLTESATDQTPSDLAPAGSQSLQSLQTTSGSQATPPDIQGTGDSGVLTVEDEVRIAEEEKDRRRKR